MERWPIADTRIHVAVDGSFIHGNRRGLGVSGAWPRFCVHSAHWASRGLKLQRVDAKCIKTGSLASQPSLRNNRTSKTTNRRQPEVESAGAPRPGDAPPGHICSPEDPLQSGRICSRVCLPTTNGPAPAPRAPAAPPASTQFGSSSVGQRTPNPYAEVRILHPQPRALQAGALSPIPPEAPIRIAARVWLCAARG
jgi:hypothetical protein